MRHDDAVRLLRSTLALAGVAGLAGGARAHERDFTISRDWHLPYAGENEIESRTFWDPRPNDLVQQFEYEYGITDKIAIEPGLKFMKVGSDPFQVTGADCEVRFNFLDYAVNKFLPALNVEYERQLKETDEGSDNTNQDFDNPKNAFELKGIVSYYTERGEDYTLNLNVGRVFGEGESETEGEVSFGYVHPLDFIPGWTPDEKHETKIGVEFLQGLSKEKNTSVGPVLTWRATQHLHVLLNGMYAINHRGGGHYDELRLILEWEF
jgi:hypothetical protein